jgi:ankyrin repeat protein
VIELLKTGSAVDGAVNGQHRPLQLAALLGDLEMVKLLVEDAGANPNSENPVTRLTPLHCAAYSDNPEVVRYLTSKGASGQAEDRHGMKPIHVAAFNDSARVMHLLCEVTPEYEQGGIASMVPTTTPLHVAAAYGSSSSASVLLQKNPDGVYYQDLEKQTALHWAACCGDCPTVIELLEHGADKRASDEYNFEPVRVAELCGNTAAAKLLATGDTFNKEAAMRSLQRRKKSASTLEQAEADLRKRQQNRKRYEDLGEEYGFAFGGSGDAGGDGDNISQRNGNTHGAIANNAYYDEREEDNLAASAAASNDHIYENDAQNSSTRPDMHINNTYENALAAAASHEYMPANDAEPSQAASPQVDPNNR